MATDFFEQQDIARKRSGRLVFLMIAAVIGIVLVTYPIIAIAFYFLSGGAKNPEIAPNFFNPALFALVSLVTLATVCFSSLYKVAALKSGGGGSVARSLGGRLIQPDTADPNERKLLNVVEEMAIASGTPVPPVYLLENERGINAFAAGYKPDDAVLGVTRGAIEQLSRDELQGVIAHEFSHVLNGDMRLNIRLMGMIFGILAIGILGRIALRGAFYSSFGRRKDGRAVAAMAIVGILLTIIGAIGVLFGKLIKAAISRQREFLADASAVQFTRNPGGISSALQRLAMGSKIDNPHAEEASHMFFGEAVGSWMGGSMATHPPLPERIRRIDPSWDGTFPQPREVETKNKPGGQAQGARKTGLDDVFGAIPKGVLEATVVGGMAGGAVGGAVAMDSIGQLDDAHIAYARELIAGIPGELREAARTAAGSQAVVFAVLLDGDQTIRDQQLKHLQNNADDVVSALTVRLVDASRELSRAARLPLIDMALPALQQMSTDDYPRFCANVDALIEADKKVDLFEWTLRRLLMRHLEAHLFKPTDPKVRYYNLRPLAGACAVILSTLARVGATDQAEIKEAYDAGTGELGIPGMRLLPGEECKLSEVAQAFDKLASVSAREKKKLLRGCAKTIAADGKVTLSEGELMRAIADSLDCPMPPLLPGQVLV